MNESELEIVAQRLRENGDDFSCLQMQMNPGYEARDVNLLSEAVLANHTLKAIDFFGILSEDDVNEAVRRLVESFGSLPNLRSLKIAGYCMGLLATLGRLLGRVPCLRKLTIVYVELQGDFDTFNEALRQHPCLETFEILDCQLPESLRDTTVLNSILASFAHNNNMSNLKQLALSPINPISLGKIPVETLTQICHLQPNLETFQVFGFHPMIHDGLPAMLPVLEILRESQNIRYLRLVMGLDELSWRAMAEFLQRTTSLKRLEIDLSPYDPSNGNNDLPESVAVNYKHILHVARILPYNYNLQNLIFRDGFGGPVIGTDLSSEETLESFGKYLETNYSLLVMEPCTPTITMYTKLNQHGRKQLIQDEDSSREDWVSKIIEVRDDLESIYYFLSMNPLLCDLLYSE